MKAKLIAVIIAVLVLWLSCHHASQAAEAPKSSAVEKAESFVDKLAAGDAASAAKEFDARVTAALDSDGLARIWKELQAQAGPFQKRLGTSTKTANGYETVFVTCQFKNMALDAALTYDGAGKVAGLHFLPSQSATQAEYQPPAYAHPESFEEKEMSVAAAGECALPATLTLPKGTGPFPAVVLIHGSGPNDRDETIGPNKPFKDIAWGLASRGIAVLRYEKRTKVCAAEMIALKDKITVKEETVDDAAAAVTLLRKTDKIDAGLVFVLGHSLGGVLVPRIGAAAPKAAGFIIMAGTARPLEDVILDQVTYISSLSGGQGEKAQLELIKAQAARVKSPSLSPETPSSDLPFGAPASYWLDLRGYDPPAAALLLHRPLLILQGERDYQATMMDFAAWKKDLQGTKDATFKSYPALNHLFMEGVGKATPAEYEKASHVSSEVIGDIAAWILKHETARWEKQRGTEAAPVGVGRALLPGQRKRALTGEGALG